MGDILDSTTYASADMQQLCRELAPVVHSAAPILFWGETGSGMGFYARALHDESRTGKFLTIPCFSLDEDTVQKQFLGVNDQRGWLEEAHNGTIFLKRVAETSLSVQQTLLHLMNTQTSDGRIEFSRKGGTTENLEVNVRFIYSAANDIDTALQKGMLRQDLIDEIRKLGKIAHIPPLRDRKEDIISIAKTLFDDLNQKYDQHVISFDKRATELVLDYQWPGNVSELRRILTSIFSQYFGITAITEEHVAEYVFKPGISGTTYTFTLKNDEKFKGKFASEFLRVQRDKSEFQLETRKITEILRVEDKTFAPPKLKHFIVKLRDGSQLAATLLDKTIRVETSFDTAHQVAVHDLCSVSLT